MFQNNYDVSQGGSGGAVRGDQLKIVGKVLQSVTERVLDT